MRLTLYAISTLFAAFSANFAFGQHDTISEQLLLGNIYKILKEDTTIQVQSHKSSVAGFRDEDIRETPGAVLVITNAQIRAMGATDLMDVLNAIPGIELGRDVDDVTGIAMRGLWAHEGKVLVMVNGMPLNDLDFGTYALGGRFPISNINRIEIMNGPGSVVHGGFAALGVINIVLKTPQEQSGTSITCQSSISNGYLSDNSAGIVSNHQISKDTYVTLQANVRNALRSTWTDYRSDGTPISYGDSTRINTQQLYLGITKKRFASQLYLNNYTYNVSDEEYSIMMFGLAWQNTFSKQFTEKSLFSFKSVYNYQMPWFNLNNSDPDIISTNTISQRFKLHLMYETRLSPHISWINGLQGYTQGGRIVARSQTYSINDENKILFGDLAFHSELVYAGKAGILRLAGRLEKNSFTPLMFAPRFAWNKAYKKWLFKFMMNSAFKIPTVQNINLSGDSMPVKHETVRNIETSVGYNPNSQSSMEVIFYHTSIFNPIFYYVDTIQYDNYLNGSRTGTYGFEMRYQYTGHRFDIMTGYCLYEALHGPEILDLVVDDGLKKQLLGLPNHKTSLTCNIHLGESLDLYATGIYLGAYRAYGDIDENTSEVLLTDKKSTTLVHSGIILHPKKLKSLRIQCMVSNVFNQRFEIASPNMNGIGAMPLYARQFTLNVLWHINS
ncbi:MAG: TonB-dependent receptor plug domain-containing protein [Flavobacteriales bacterium]|nr:TonB-dependent receptor plug domain-containing protein [Flavobacteriales bacterium]